MCMAYPPCHFAHTSRKHAMSALQEVTQRHSNAMNAWVWAQLGTVGAAVTCPCPLVSAAWSPPQDCYPPSLIAQYLSTSAPHTCCSAWSTFTSPLKTAPVASLHSALPHYCPQHTASACPHPLKAHIDPQPTLGCFLHAKAAPSLPASL